MRVGTNYVIGNSQLKVQVYLLTHESLLSIRLKTFLCTIRIRMGNLLLSKREYHSMF